MSAVFSSSFDDGTDSTGGRLLQFTDDLCLAALVRRRGLPSVWSLSKEFPHRLGSYVAVDDPIPEVPSALRSCRGLSRLLFNEFWLVRCALCWYLLRL
jgi:hypothetical protein